MDKSTIENTNIILFSFAMFGIFNWLLAILIYPHILWVILLWILIIITIDRYKEVKYERQSR